MVAGKMANMVLHFQKYTGEEMKAKGWSDYVNPGDVGLAYEPVSFRTPTDNLRIKGWLIPAEDREASKKRVAILLVHGRTANKSTMVRYMPWLHKAGYTLMAIDLRAHGESEGDTSTMAMYEPRDVRGALRIFHILGFNRVVLMGFSMGATTSLMTATQSAPGVVGVIAEAGFNRMLDVLEFNGRKMFGPVVAPFIPLVKFRLTSELNQDPEVVNVADRWPKTGGVPALIIQGEIDDTVPPENANIISKALGKDATLYRCAKSAHVQCFRDHPKEYISKVLGFLKRFPATP